MRSRLREKNEPRQSKRDLAIAEEQDCVNVSVKWADFKGVKAKQNET
jgi:hypothetical protein